ncbi:PRC-barrel domain-containing protein [Halospina denitrificans]|nr:PRC-barrel domain-containing protein [Halospina denitrificans]
MKNLTALTLSAALVPALALSTAAFAESDDGMQMQDQERSSEQQRSGMQQSSGEKYLSGKPAGGSYADELIGQSVKHRESGEEIGQIQDLVIGKDGNIAGVVLSTGSFLGLGGQKVGLAWDQLQQSQEENESVFYVDMDEETLRNAPEFRSDQEE